MIGEDINFDLLEFTPPDGEAVNFQLELTPPHSKLFSFYASGKIGEADWPNPHGHFGIYQMRMHKDGKKPIRMKFYEPTNPQTEDQQANRNKFADAMAAWQALTSEEKAPYYTQAKRVQMLGHNLYIKRYMLEN